MFPNLFLCVYLVVCHTYNVFYKLYESIVCHVIMYGANMEPQYEEQNVLVVFRRSKVEQLDIYFLNVGKYTPVPAVNGDTAWYPLECRFWKSDLNREHG